MSSSTDIQRELEDTRARMSAEIDALGYKLDLPSRAKDRVNAATRKARRATPSTGDVRDTAESNPIGLALGGLAVGFLAGLLIPQTSIEDEQLGPIADRVRDEAVATGREALQRGKSVARKATDSAKETATAAGRDQAQALSRSGSRRAKSVT
jgi:hypothetical protein